MMIYRDGRLPDNIRESDVPGNRPAHKRYRHSPKGIAKAAEWTRVNKEKIAAHKKVYFERHREHLTAKNREWRAKNAEAIRAQRYTIEGRMRDYRNGASARGIKFELVLSDFQFFWQRSCWYCGDPVKTIGLDRMVNTLGYVRKNVVSCCSPCNTAKMTANFDDFIARCHRIAQRHK